MKFFILFSMIITICSSAFAVNEQCVGVKTATLKASENAPYSYEIVSSGYSFKIDGQKESFEGAVDRESVKRLFMYCSSVTVECLNHDSAKKSGAIEVSFKINNEPSAKPKELVLTAKTPLNEKVKKCLLEKWSNLEMPRPGTQASAKFTIEYSKASK